MDPAATLSAFRQEFVTLGLFRLAAAAGSTTAAPYPAIIEPPEGAMAPGELPEELNDHTKLVVSLFYGGELAPATNYDAATRRRDIIDVRYRSVGNDGLRMAMAANETIRDHLKRPAINYGYGWQMAAGHPSALWVHESVVWAGFGGISRGRDRAFDHVAKYLIEVAG